MFLLFALRRATMPSLARASRENGSIPYITQKTHSSSIQDRIYHHSVCAMLRLF